MFILVTIPIDFEHDSFMHPLIMQELTKNTFSALLSLFVRNCTFDKHDCLVDLVAHSSHS